MIDRPGAEHQPAEAQWRRLAERAIGASLDDLTTRSADGLPIAPLYARQATDPAQSWRTNAAWSIAQRIDHPDAREANRLALLDLESGADALVLVGAGSPFARGFSLEAGALGEALAGVELDLISLRLDAGPGTLTMLTALADIVVERRLTSAALEVDIGFDPLGWHARLGRPVEADPAALLALRNRAGLGGTFFLADGRPYHEAGAGEAQELAAVLATAVAYLRSLQAAGVALDDARRAISVLLPVDADVFLSLAKLRAVRRLWARVESACGLQPVPLRLRTETSWRMMTRHDPWTNVMRTTAATFAAGLGGADRIAVLPFTLAAGRPDAAARRLARNLQRVLLDEAQLGHVADPAAGSGAFEALTDGLCREAWARFQGIERDGGIGAALPRLRREIAETASARAEALRRLEHPIIGTSRFPSLDAPNLAICDVAASPPTDCGPDALPDARDTAPFEALRARGERLATSGRAQVLLATLGPAEAHQADVDRATGIFAVAGLATTTVAATDAMRLADAAGAARIACLCGADADAVAPLVTALRRAGIRRILGVGRQPLPGVDAVIAPGSDVVAGLAAVLAAIEDAGPDIEPSDQSGVREQKTQ